MQILVASDAVGMGLNLNIRRIIFHSIMKFEGALWLPSTCLVGPYSTLSELKRHARPRIHC